MRKKTPRDYPETMPGAESVRLMTRGEKEVSFTVQGKRYIYLQPGWWCSMTDPDDMEGQVVDEDNQIADMARRMAKAIAQGETLYVPVLIRAIRQRCGLTEREAGLLFGTGEKSFEKYESGEIQPSEPTKRLLKFAMEKPELFARPETGTGVVPSTDDVALAHQALRDAEVDRIYGQLFAPVADGSPQP